MPPRALASPQASKSKLPDTGSEYEGAGGTVADAVSFLLSNFAEMNKLWVRMQHQGPVREREQREKERMDLRILVGTNLASLSKLEGVDLAMYQSSVFPQILEQVRETVSPRPDAVFSSAYDIFSGSGCELQGCHRAAIPHGMLDSSVPDGISHSDT